MAIYVKNGVGVYDSETVLNDSAASAVSGTSGAAGTVGGSAKVVDLGAAARTDGKFVVNISENGTSASMKQTIKLQGSDDNFTSDIVDLVILETGHSGQLPGDENKGAGKYVLPYTNVINGKAYRYLRAFASTSATSSDQVKYVGYLIP